MDLLEAFQQTYSQESPPFDCEGTDENAQPLDGRKEATGLEQVTEDVCIWAIHPPSHFYHAPFPPPPTLPWPHTSLKQAG